ncbi:MAG TPA: 4Fe-4S dicluster domain-containing protein [Geobacterales bacterium]|nr:4Fe-4S dicluster domain-containing protein [Geobacterales bacterium]
MAKFITEENLRQLVDRLLTEGVRTVGPRLDGGILLYAPLGEGDHLVLGKLPRRSAKETFFPPSETILAYERGGAGVQLTDVPLANLPETVLITAAPCDTAAPAILDAVFSWDYKDEFYLERRRKTTIVGMGCSGADDACFCSAVGLSPAAEAGADLFLAPATGGYLANAVTEKGEFLLGRFPDLFVETSATATVVASPSSPPLELDRVKSWLDTHFDDPFWQEMSDACIGCGSCAFLCPACHCFDIMDEGGESKGCRRKSWDACGFGKFTLHASAHNPRDLQNKRYRNRLMHKFSYYVDKFGQRLCTGCGRCIRACPVGIDIAALLERINRQE